MLDRIFFKVAKVAKRPSYYFHSYRRAAEVDFGGNVVRDTSIFWQSPYSFAELDAMGFPSRAGLPNRELLSPTCIGSCLSRNALVD